MALNKHHLAEQRSIAIHRHVAEQLRERPELRAQAQLRVKEWLRSGSVDPFYAKEWQQLLALPIDDLVVALQDPSEHGRALRQVSPFAGAVAPRTRWRIWRQVRTEVEGNNRKDAA